MTCTFMKFMDLCSRIQIKKRRKKCEFWFSNTFSNLMQFLLSNAEILYTLLSAGSEVKSHGREGPPSWSPSELSTSDAATWNNLQ